MMVLYDFKSAVEQLETRPDVPNELNVRLSCKSEFLLDAAELEQVKAEVTAAFARSALRIISERKP